MSITIKWSMKLDQYMTPTYPLPTVHGINIANFRLPQDIQMNKHIQTSGITHSLGRRWWMYIILDSPLVGVVCEHTLFFAIDYQYHHVSGYISKYWQTVIIWSFKSSRTVIHILQYNPPRTAGTHTVSVISIMPLSFVIPFSYDNFSLVESAG